jgi:hypothetical protein
MPVVRVTVTTPLLAGALLITLLAAAGCGQGSGTDPGGSVTPTSSSGTEVPADLTIVVDDGKGTKTTWHLTCSPAGGDHPDPAKACAALARRGRIALAAVPADQLCTQVYGGPQTARIMGTWQGEPVDVRLSRTDGCQIARWDALVGLLPAGGA